MYRVALLSLFLTSAACQSTCVESANTETNSQEECKYLKPCTVESGKVPVSAPEGYSVECEKMPCPADQDIMFDKIDGTDIGELLPASCDNTVAMCKDACEQTTGCCGFNFVWNPGAYSSTSMGRCVAKACDGRIGTSRYGMVFFARDGGAVPAPVTADTTEAESMVVVLAFAIAGSLDDVTDGDITGIKNGIASAAGVDPTHVTVGVTAGSVTVSAVIQVPATASPAAFQADLINNLGATTADVSSALGVTVETVPTASVTTQSDASSNIIINNWQNVVKDAIALGTGVLIAIIVAPTLVLLCVIGLIVYCCCCKKKQGVSNVA